MNHSTHALISLEERFAQGILNGTKLVEVRRRPMRLHAGTILWMYVKVPIGGFEYFAGVKRGFVLVLGHPMGLASPFPLERLRTLNDGFQPPQFFQHLASDSALVSAFIVHG